MEFTAVLWPNDSKVSFINSTVSLRHILSLRETDGKSVKFCVYVSPRSFLKSWLFSKCFHDKHRYAFRPETIVNTIVDSIDRSKFSCAETGQTACPWPLDFLHPTMMNESHGQVTVVGLRSSSSSFSLGSSQHQRSKI